MKKTSLTLCPAPWPHQRFASFEDFKVGRLALSKHLALGDVGVLSLDPQRYSRQLLLKQPSDLRSGRVPLYVCAMCGDLGCGALTVQVTLIGEGFVWQDFRYEGFSTSEAHVSDIMARLGPFVFEAEAYRSLLRPFGFD